MEAVLTGVPQFILTSMNFLITSAQAGYITNLDREMAKRIEEKKRKNFGRFKTNWRLIFFGELTLALSAICLVVFRIIPSLFFLTDAQERVHPYFITTDIVLIAATGLGYLLITWHAFRAWHWSSWGDKTQADLVEYHRVEYHR